MGCDTTGPPCSVTVELKLDRGRHDVIAWPARLSHLQARRGMLQTKTDDSDHY